MTEIRLRHLPFFEALATSPSETSPQWRAANAGLLVLRVVDRALTDVERVTARELAAVHVAYRGMDQGDATAPMIRRTLQALEAEDLGRIAVSLRDLGRVYLSQAAWALGRDVYATGVEAAQIADREDVVLACLFGEGHAIRMLRQFDEAAAHYTRLHTLATRLGDTRHQLEARLGLAKLLIDRGDLKEATVRIDRLIERARELRSVEMESKALHDRARVAGESGDYPSALRFAYDALQLCDEPRERDRILTDVAHALALVGEYAAARDGSLIVAATAQEQDMRWLATINLMELASREGRAAEFETYRRQLATEPLPPQLRASYHRAEGAGFVALGQSDEARDAYVRMRDVSQRQRLAQSVIEADDALRQLEAEPRGAVEEVVARYESPSFLAYHHVRWVASEITRLRERTGVSA
jgi:tetratricopeptide (TPR) repeat protein